ncbi:MarR family winged helix-turn-helix transcriptional regulator [Micromonospora sp. M12]
MRAADQAGGDGRVRTATLTDAGRTQWADLDQRSDDLAASILEPLTENRRERLVTAMAEVERLLVGSMVVIEPCPPNDPRARACLRAYAREIASRFDDGFDPALSSPVHDEALVPPAGCSCSPPSTPNRSAAARSNFTRRTRRDQTRLGGRHRTRARRRAAAAG